jgi:hypothetical protein
MPFEAFSERFQSLFRAFSKRFQSAVKGLVTSKEILEEGLNVQGSMFMFRVQCSMIRVGFGSRRPA